MKIVKSFVDPDNINQEWGLGLDGDLYHINYETEYIKVYVAGEFVPQLRLAIPQWKLYNKESNFGISIKTMKHILNNFSALIPFA